MALSINVEATIALRDDPNDLPDCQSLDTVDASHVASAGRLSHVSNVGSPDTSSDDSNAQIKVARVKDKCKSGTIRKPRPEKRYITRWSDRKLVDVFAELRSVCTRERIDIKAALEEAVKTTVDPRSTGESVVQALNKHRRKSQQAQSQPARAASNSEMNAATAPVPMRSPSEMPSLEACPSGQDSGALVKSEIQGEAHMVSEEEAKDEFGGLEWEGQCLQ